MELGSEGLYEPIDYFNLLSKLNAPLIELFGSKMLLNPRWYLQREVKKVDYVLLRIYFSQGDTAFLPSLWFLAVRRLAA
jgi:hypothetical protein